jgi:hypothetical protein
VTDKMQQPFGIDSTRNSFVWVHGFAAEHA